MREQFLFLIWELYLVVATMYKVKPQFKIKLLYNKIWLMKTIGLGITLLNNPLQHQISPLDTNPHHKELNQLHQLWYAGQPHFRSIPPNSKHYNPWSYQRRWKQITDSHTHTHTHTVISKKRTKTNQNVDIIMNEVQMTSIFICSFVLFSLLNQYILEMQQPKKHLHNVHRHGPFTQYRYVIPKITL